VTTCLALVAGLAGRLGGHAMAARRVIDLDEMGQLLGGNCPISSRSTLRGGDAERVSAPDDTLQA
jgi:hypothetical protein